MLGALLGSTGWKDRVSFNTLGAESSPDVRIASTLVDLVGGRFYTGHDESVLQPVTLRVEHRLLAQLLRRGVSPLRRGLSQPARGEPHGAGRRGSLRRAVPRFLDGGRQDHIQTSATAAELATRLVSAASQPEWRSHVDLDAVADDLAADLERGAGETLEDMVEDHYLRHRNRSHCGMRGFTLVHERAVWYRCCPAACSLRRAASTTTSDPAIASSSTCSPDFTPRWWMCRSAGLPSDGCSGSSGAARSGSCSTSRSLRRPKRGRTPRGAVTRTRHVVAGAAEPGLGGDGREDPSAGDGALQRIEEIGLSAELAAALQRRMDALFDASARRGYQLAMRILAIDALLAPPPFAAVPGPGLRQD